MSGQRGRGSSSLHKQGVQLGLGGAASPGPHGLAGPSEPRAEAVAGCSRDEEAVAGTSLEVSLETQLRQVAGQVQEPVGGWGHVVLTAKARAERWARACRERPLEHAEAFIENKHIQHFS